MTMVFAVRLATTSGLYPSLLPLVHVPKLAADKGLIRFDGAAKIVDRAVLHRETKTVQHEPRGLLSHAERPRDLVAAHAVLAIRDHPHSGEPLVQADGRVLKDGPDLDGELLTLVVLAASPHAPGRDERRTVAPAGWAAHVAVRPPQLNHEAKADIRVGEVADGLDQGLGSGGVLVHALRIADLALCVKYIITPMG
jgi:hypothetical protein